MAEHAKSGPESRPRPRPSLTEWPVKRLAWVSLVLPLFVAACGRPSATSNTAPSAPAAAPAIERAGPVRWNAGTGGFEFNGQPLKTIKLWTFDGSTDGFR